MKYKFEFLIPRMMKTIEYIAKKTENNIENQVKAIEVLHKKSGIILAVTAIFSPIFLYFIGNANIWLRVVASSFVVLQLIGVIILMWILKPKKLMFSTFKISQYDELIDKSLDEVFKFEVETFREVYIKNQNIVDKQVKSFKRGFLIVVLSIVLCIGLLIIDSIGKDFFNNEQQTKEELIRKRELRYIK